MVKYSRIFHLNVLNSKNIENQHYMNNQYFYFTDIFKVQDLILSWGPSIKDIRYFWPFFDLQCLAKKLVFFAIYEAKWGLFKLK